MIAFEVKLNGKKLFIAGIEDWVLIDAMITANPDMADDGGNYYDLKVGGLPKQIEEGKIEHIRWPDTKLNIGDEVVIKIVEVSEADQPLKRFRSDREVQENPFTDEEMYEFQKQDYLRLKEKFKNEDFA